MSPAPVLHWRGRLAGAPFPATPKRAEATALPLRSDGDFAMAASFRGTAGVPVLLDFAEHYALLALLVTEARRRLPDVPYLLLSLNLPGGRRLPPALLAADVLIVQDVALEAEDLARRGIPCLTIVTRCRRHNQEAGDNGVELALAGAPHQAAALAELGVFLERFAIVAEPSP